MSGKDDDTKVLPRYSLFDPKKMVIPGALFVTVVSALSWLVVHLYHTNAKQEMESNKAEIIAQIVNVENYSKGKIDRHEMQITKVESDVRIDHDLLIRLQAQVENQAHSVDDIRLDVKEIKRLILERRNSP